MQDLMIDLETLGTDPNCPVISIGAVFFDIATKKLGATFHMALDVNEQIRRGRKPTGDTIRWWMGQTDAAKRVFHEKARLAPEVLQTLSTWYTTEGLTRVSKVNGLLDPLPQRSRGYVWGNGSTFDISILEDIFRDYGLECPWGYNRIMDLRTFKRFKAPDKRVIVSGTAHNALDDAVGQANFVLENA